ncbi:MAG: tripeptide aminopeptidase PepT [Elusimicrobia bacterium]|nr:tripeptide aminopeptidase PepT [Elusimicrobiota bacterium]MDY5729315.1 tripeptide aminopeptidase PepT [Elusimicrobiaceae bacterium]
MQVKQLLAVLSVFMFGLSFVSQAYAASFPSNFPRETVSLKDSARQRIGQQNARLAAQYRAGMLNRFLKYTTYDSQSSDNQDLTPEQIETAKKLFAEIQKFGFKTTLSEHYYIYVEIPSNLEWNVPTLGFSCHYDTTPDIIGKGIKAQTIEKYDGKPIELKNGHVMTVETDPYLKQMIGKTIVTSDGTTMLSADDKAGVSVIVTFIQTLAENPSKKHGNIQIVITPNEDVGRSADYIEETPYNPDIAFDFDGGVNGEVVVGNFNAEKVIYRVFGVNGHQSEAATNGYRNAWKPACELGAACAKEEWLPNNSRGQQGYVELHHMDMSDGKVNVAELDFRLRDFHQQNIDNWKNYADSVAKDVSAKYGVKIERAIIKKQYGNVAESIHPQARQVVTNAFKNAGVTPNFKEERAGTTASMLMLKLGRGAYTVFTGQNNPHAFTEWLSEEDMFKAYLVALNLADEVVMMRK